METYLKHAPTRVCTPPTGIKDKGRKIEDLPVYHTVPERGITFIIAPMPAFLTFAAQTTRHVCIRLVIHEATTTLESLRFQQLGLHHVTNRGSLAHTNLMTNWLLVIFGGVLLPDQVSANAACCRVIAVPFFAKDEGLLDGSIRRIYIYTCRHTD
jgi:hypothetical protein